AQPHKAVVGAQSPQADSDHQDQNQHQQDQNYRKKFHRDFLLLGRGLANGYPQDSDLFNGPLRIGRGTRKFPPTSVYAAPKRASSGSNPFIEIPRLLWAACWSTRNAVSASQPAAAAHSFAVFCVPVAPVSASNRRFWTSSTSPAAFFPASTPGW